MIERLSSVDPGVLAAGIGLALLWLVVLQVLLVIWWLRLRRLMRGKTGRDLEGVILALGQEVDGLKEREVDTRAALARIRHHLERALTQVHLVRFNPFGSGVAEQSFSLALLDSSGNGVVISCLQSGDGASRVYGKQVERRTSAYRLSPEEERAIAEAMKVH